MCHVHSGDYMTLPASQYSVLDGAKVERLTDDTFRVHVTSFSFFGFRVEPVLTLTVQPTDTGCCIEMLACKLAGSPMIEAQNKKFAARMTNIGETHAACHVSDHNTANERFSRRIASSSNRKRVLTHTIFSWKRCSGLLTRWSEHLLTFVQPTPCLFFAGTSCMLNFSYSLCSLMQCNGGLAKKGMRRRYLATSRLMLTLSSLRGSSFLMLQSAAQETRSLALSCPRLFRAFLLS